MQGSTQITFFVLVNSTVQVTYGITVEAVPGGEVIDAGTFPAFGLTGVEGISLLDRLRTGSFGLLSGEVLAAIAGENGFVIADLATGQVVLDQTGSGSPIGPQFGLIGLQNGGSSLLFPFGFNGNAFYDTQGTGVVNTTATTFDAFPAAGDVSSGWATVVSPSEGVKYVSPSAGSPYGFLFKSEVLTPNLFLGELVSAYMAEGSDTAPTLIVSRDVNSRLYYYNRTDISLALTIGLDARKIRCADNGSGMMLCGVTIFGDDRVALVPWDGSSLPTLAGFANVGDGPVDLDIRVLATGNYGILTTGFNDNTVTEIEVSASGSVVSSETRAAPADCINPGHAIYAEDTVGWKVVATCYTSDNYFVQISRF